MSVRGTPKVNPRRDSAISGAPLSALRYLSKSVRKLTKGPEDTRFARFASECPKHVREGHDYAFRDFLALRLFALPAITGLNALALPLPAFAPRRPDAIFIFLSGFSPADECRLKRHINLCVIPLCLKSLARVVQFGKSLDKDHRVGVVYKVLKTIFIIHKISLGVVRVEADKPDVLLAVLFVKAADLLMEA